MWQQFYNRLMLFWAVASPRRCPPPEPPTQPSHMDHEREIFCPGNLNVRINQILVEDYISFNIATFINNAQKHQAMYMYFQIFSFILPDFSKIDWQNR